MATTIKTQTPSINPNLRDGDRIFLQGDPPQLLRHKRIADDLGFQTGIIPGVLASRVYVVGESNYLALIEHLKENNVDGYDHYFSE